MRKEGGKLIVEAVEKRANLLEVLANMQPSAGSFPEFDDPLPEPVEL